MSWHWLWALSLCGSLASACSSGAPERLIQPRAGTVKVGTVPASLSSAAASPIACFADMVCLADSTGTATPFQLKRFLPEVIAAPGPIPLILHLHDTEGLGMANFVAALECGVRRFDTAFGGLGGCPFIPGASGNITTEDVVTFLDKEGLSTGIDARAVAQCSQDMATFLGESLPGKQYRLLKPKLPSPSQTAKNQIGNTNANI